MSITPSIMVAGPKTGAFDSVARALDTNSRDGAFVVISWDTEAAGTRTDLEHYREKARLADGIVFVFGPKTTGTTDAGTVMKADSTVAGATVRFNTTATEQEYLAAFLRPVPHLVLVPQRPILDPILGRLIKWSHEALGRTPCYYKDVADAVEKAITFVRDQVATTLKERAESEAQVPPDLAPVGAHDFGLKADVLSVAPRHVRTALDELALSFKARRQESEELLQIAEGAVVRAGKLTIYPPSLATLKGASALFTCLREWSAKGPAKEGLADASTFLQCYVQSLNGWERVVLLMASVEAGLIARYRRQHAAELDIHLPVAYSVQLLRVPAETTDPILAKVGVWASTRWKEVFAAAAAYGGVPSIVLEHLDRDDWAVNMEASFRQLDKWKILSEQPGNWLLRWHQMVGVVHAAEGKYAMATEHFDEAIRLSQSLSGRQLVHSLIFKLFVTESPSVRSQLHKQIQDLSVTPGRKPDSLRRWYYQQHANDLWLTVFPRVAVGGA